MSPSIIPWKVCPVFCNSKDILVYWNRPNGVIIAVILILVAGMGIWWYPCFKSSLLKNVQLLRIAARLSILGSRYLSGSVMRLNHQKITAWLPHTVWLFCVCRGEAHQLIDLLTVPYCSMSAKAALVTACITRSRLWNLAVTAVGRQVVHLN